MSETIVSLDLRGRRFKTLRSTFDKLDLSAISYIKINENSYFIDRDPKYFHLILDFASSGGSLRGLSYGKLAGVSYNADAHANFEKETKLYGLCHCYIGDNEIQSIYSKDCKKHKEQFIAFINRPGKKDSSVELHSDLYD